MPLSFPSSPSVGQLYPSPPITNTPVWKWDGSEWVLSSGTTASVLTQFEYTGLTTCTGTDNNGATLAYQPGLIEVFVNGLKLNKGDYTATNGTSVVIGSTVGATDLVTILAFAAISGSNTLAPSNDLSDVASASAARANIGAALAPTVFTNALTADVALNNLSTFFDGPSVAQGTSGTFFVIGAVLIYDTNGAAASFDLKLWDGTTVIDSARAEVPSAQFRNKITLQGVITNPAGNLRVSVNDRSFTTGKIAFNQSGLGKDSTITAVRIA